jgi:hypothetical protein
VVEKGRRTQPVWLLLVFWKVRSFLLKKLPRKVILLGRSFRELVIVSVLSFRRIILCAKAVQIATIARGLGLKYLPTLSAESTRTERSLAKVLARRLFSLLWGFIYST